MPAASRPGWGCSPKPSPEPGGTTEPSAGGGHRQTLGVFKSRSKRRVLAGCDGGRSSRRCQWDGDEEPAGDAEIFRPGAGSQPFHRAHKPLGEV